MQNLKAALAKKEKLIGTFSFSGSPTIIEILGFSGLDFVIICTEHAFASPYGDHLEHLIRAANASGITPIVRVIANDAGMILKALDSGAKGIMVPHINTVEDAKKVVSAVKYAPEGARGSCPAVRAAHYGGIPWAEHRKKANAETAVILLVEDKEGADNIEELAAVAGVDAIFLGSFDLSVQLQVSHLDPLIEKYRAKFIKTCRARGLAFGDLAWSLESALVYGKNADLLAVGVDTQLFRTQMSEIADSLAVLKTFKQVKV